NSATVISGKAVPVLSRPCPPPTNRPDPPRPAVVATTLVATGQVATGGGAGTARAGKGPRARGPPLVTTTGPITRAPGAAGCRRPYHPPIAVAKRAAMLAIRKHGFMIYTMERGTGHGEASVRTVLRARARPRARWGALGVTHRPRSPGRS